MRDAQQKHREGSLRLCPCSLCLNRVQLRESDVNKHIVRYGLADESVSCEENEDKDMHESSSEMTATFQEGCHSMPSSSLGSQIVEPPLKETKISSLDETSSSESSVSRGSLSAGFAYDDDPSDRSPSSAAMGSTASPSSEVSDDNSFSPSGSSAHESESTDTESVREIPDYLQQLVDEEELYCSDKANLPLFEGSTASVLQALCGYFSWFTEHPGTSKSALSDLLRLHHDEILPRDNYLPSSYDEAVSFIKPFLLPFVTYHACRNDCVLFRKSDRYDYSDEERCPECEDARFISKGKPYRKFYYYPLEPRWRRMFGTATIAEVLQSHSGDTESSMLQDVIGSGSWKSVYSETGFFKGDSRGLALQLSTDGVNPFSGNKVVYSMWPVMLTVLNFPKRLRNVFENMLLVGIIPGNGGREPKKVDPYLELVVDELLKLSGSQFYDAFRKAPFTFKVKILNYVLDYPGLNKVFSAVGANALQGCMWCEIRGKPNCMVPESTN